ncbi:MAG TPA: hypothetical protein DCE56_10130, partial [Cyanobacteria bacterium UBA8553]|nr:hypothetical protein [Cyanobacteria bacterium UBA8553]
MALDSPSSQALVSFESSSVVSDRASGKPGVNSQPGQPTSLKILLVEDTPINLKLVQHQVR